MWKIVIPLSVLLVSSTVTYGIYVVAKNRAYRSGFEAIERGMAKSEVIDAMGRPDSERAGCRDRPTWLGKHLDDQVCMTEYQYNARLLPEFWTVGFGTDGKVIAKYDYISP